MNLPIFPYSQRDIALNQSHQSNNSVGTTIEQTGSSHVFVYGNDPRQRFNMDEWEKIKCKVPVQNRKLHRMENNNI